MPVKACQSTSSSSFQRISSSLIYPVCLALSLGHDTYPPQFEKTMFKAGVDS
jgi:hypothetical protein